MEVAVKMEALSDGEEDKTLMLGMYVSVRRLDIAQLTTVIGRFSMVCRDAFTHRAHPVNPLKVSTPEEHSLHHIGDSKY